MEIILKPYQEKFYFSEERFVALIAGIGTGKTHMGLLKMWNFCKTYPDSLALLLRKQQTDAHGSTLKDFRQYFGVEFDSRNEFKFPNGSTIVAKHAGEVDALKNYNISFILWEQAEEGTEEIFDYLRDRLRRRTSPYQQLCILANANGENFLKKLFVNNAQRVNVIDESTGQREYFSEGFHCITASTFANESNLDEKFIKDLRSMEKTSPNHYRQMVLNDMTGFSSDDALFSYAELTACKRKFDRRNTAATCG